MRRRRLLPWFLLGLATGLAALAIGGPRTWSATVLRQHLQNALLAGNVKPAEPWFEPFVRHWRDLPLELLIEGNRLAGLNDPEALEKYAAAVLDSRAEPDEATAAAHLWRCTAMAMRNDRDQAMACYHTLIKDYSDFYQALEAEQFLKRLTNQTATDEIVKAALAENWERLLQLADDFENRELFSEERDLIASHVFEALLATAQPEQAELRLQKWARANGGFNIPAVIQPFRLKQYPAAITILDNVTRHMAADNPWRASVAGVAAVLRGDAVQLRRLAPDLPAGQLVDLAGCFIDQGTSRTEGESLLAAADRPDLNDLEHLRLAFHTARARLAWGDRTGAARAVAAGLAIRLEDPIKTELEIIGIKTGDTSDWQATITEYEKVLDRHRGDENMMLWILRDAQQYLLTDQRTREACDLARRYEALIENAEMRELLLQPCRSF